MLDIIQLEQKSRDQVQIFPVLLARNGSQSLTIAKFNDTGDAEAAPVQTQLRPNALLIKDPTQAPQAPPRSNALQIIDPATQAPIQIQDTSLMKDSTTQVIELPPRSNALLIKDPVTQAPRSNALSIKDPKTQRTQRASNASNEAPVAQHQENKALQERKSTPSPPSSRLGRWMAPAQ